MSLENTKNDIDVSELIGNTANDIEELEQDVSKFLEYTEALNNHQDELHEDIFDLNQAIDQTQPNNAKSEERIKKSLASFSKMLEYLSYLSDKIESVNNKL